MKCRVVLFLMVFTLMFVPDSFSQTKKSNEQKNTINQFIIDNFPLRTPSKWVPGDVFIYADSTLNITITSDSLIDRSENIFSKEFTFVDFKEKTDWLGNSSMFLVFESDNKVYYYNTKKNLSQLSDTLYNPLIPSFVSKKEFLLANELLKNKQLYILTSEWSGNNNLNKSFKYVPVNIDSITIGNNQDPFKIYFSYNNESYYIPSNFSNSLYGTSRYSFDKIFSFEDPKDKYKDIDNEVWEAIKSSRVIKGMTQNEVRLSLGKPSEIKRIPTYSGLREVWSYGSGIRINFFDARVE